MRVPEARATIARMSDDAVRSWRDLWNDARTRDLVQDAKVFFRETIWRRDDPNRGRLHGLTRRVCRVVYVFGHGSLDRHVLTSASSLTFHTLLSMVPLMAVAFSLAKGLGFKKIGRAHV